MQSFFYRSEKRVMGQTAKKARGRPPGVLWAMNPVLAFEQTGPSRSPLLTRAARDQTGGGLHPQAAALRRTGPCW
jgi:hypothetical protein